MTRPADNNGSKGGAAIKRLLRYAAIYGWRRTAIKALGRLRMADSRAIGIGIFAPGRRDIGMVGCGQFGFSTIGYFIGSKFGRRFAACYDPDDAAATSFARFWGCRKADSLDDLLEDDRISIVYIASNHASHADQAARALDAGKTVYVEKPIAVDRDQLRALLAANRRVGGDRLFAGYNRPFSAAIGELRTVCDGYTEGPLSLVCVVQGHDIPPDHWYREPGEGTRIAGNVGHWLDLGIHMLSWRTGALPKLRISCHWADASATDDNLSITLSSDRGDLVSIVLTARSEPYEGIRETIIAQWGDVHCEIDDFRKSTIRQGSALVEKRYRPKDVGHRRAILQPFADEGARRDFGEVEVSTQLMLAIVDMVRSGTREGEFDPNAAEGPQT